MNAHLYLSDNYDDSITQKFLEKGHRKIECEYVHSVIQTCFKKEEIYICLVPSDYLKITKLVRTKNPYLVKSKDYKNYGTKDFLNIRALQYCDGHI